MVNRNKLHKLIQPMLQMEGPVQSLASGGPTLGPVQKPNIMMKTIHFAAVSEKIIHTKRIIKFCLVIKKISCWTFKLY